MRTALHNKFLRFRLKFFWFLFIFSTFLTRPLSAKIQLCTTATAPSYLVQYRKQSSIDHPVPCYLNSAKVFLLLSDRYRNPERDLNLGPKDRACVNIAQCLRPLGHHGRFHQKFYMSRIFINVLIKDLFAKHLEISRRIQSKWGSE